MDAAAPRSYSRTYYEPYEVRSGEVVGPVSDYEDAAYAALLAETDRLIEIQDIEFETGEDLAAAFASTRCGVRFVRAERCEVSPLAEELAS